MTVLTNNTIQPASGQALTIKDEGGTASITVATNGEATFAENIKITANKGINFSAYGSEDSDSNTTVSNNLLDDYEEGTWTPTGNGITFSNVEGHYVKIGKAVYLQGFVDFPSTANTSDNRIGNLPFVIRGGGASMALGGENFSGSQVGMIGLVNNNTFYISENFSVPTNATLSSDSFYFSGVYFTDS